MRPRDSDSGQTLETPAYNKVGIFWKVGVFWDYENCSVPKGMSGTEVASKIGDAFCEFGQVVLFKSYVEKSGETFSERVLGLQSELQGSGVSLTLCPPRGRKETPYAHLAGERRQVYPFVLDDHFTTLSSMVVDAAADPMIVADMMAFAMDNPPHSVIVLISGDGDFSYALSLLKRRHYTICVAINNTDAPAVLRTAATHVLNWRLDVLKLSVTEDLVNDSTETANIFGRDEAADIIISPNSALTTRRRSNSVSTSATSTDLDNFTELREVLQAFQREENVRPLRSQVASRVKERNPLLYGRSGGPKKFTDYAAAAESKGLVKMGGRGGSEWIQLVSSQ